MVYLENCSPHSSGYTFPCKESQNFFIIEKSGKGWIFWPDIPQRDPVNPVPAGF